MEIPPAIFRAAGNTKKHQTFKIFNFKMTFIRKKGADGKIYKVVFDDMYYIDEETEKVMIER